MAKELVECVPNFSEGRRAEVVEALAEEIAGVPGVRVLDRQMDPDHNRAVITFAGQSEGVGEAAFRAVGRASQLIDMEHHRGEHPRIGATDVIPFVPLGETPMDRCVELARRVGRRIGEELQIPVYLYERAATRPDRRNLEDLRRGEYEGLKTAILSDPTRAPDFGPRRLHPRAGAVVVGARQPLIAFNVYLKTKDVGAAKAIARAIRTRGGSLPAVKALGFEIPHLGLVQVSMNLTDFHRTSLLTAYRAVAAQAEQQGVEISHSEIVGLVPLAAVADVTGQALRLEGFTPDQILERRLGE